MAAISAFLRKPPRGYEIERANRITAYSVLAMVMVGALISWIAFLWRHA